MRFKNLTRVYDFLQVLHTKRSYSTKNDYFTRHIYFTKIYLLQKQKLNYRNYFELEIIIRNCVYSTVHDAYMYATFEYLDVHRFL
jgi:hypothetical protein